MLIGMAAGSTEMSGELEYMMSALGKRAKHPHGAGLAMSPGAKDFGTRLSEVS